MPGFDSVRGENTNCGLYWAYYEGVQREEEVRVGGGARYRFVVMRTMWDDGICEMGHELTKWGVGKGKNDTRDTHAPILKESPDPDSKIPRLTGWGLYTMNGVCVTVGREWIRMDGVNRT